MSIVRLLSSAQKNIYDNKPYYFTNDLVPEIRNVNSIELLKLIVRSSDEVTKEILFLNCDKLGSQKVGVESTSCLYDFLLNSAKDNVYVTNVNNAQPIAVIDRSIFQFIFSITDSSGQLYTDLEDDTEVILYLHHE